MNLLRRLAALTRGRQVLHRTATLAPDLRTGASVPVTELRFGNGPDLDGTFEGYLSVHGVTDSYGTRMLPGCWRAGGLDDKPYALLWMHDPTQVVGTFTAKEDERGLLISGRFDATDEGQRARTRAQSGSAPGLSVGFVLEQTLADDPNGITVARLVEGSLITARMASTPGAQVTGVRQQTAVPAGSTRAAVEMEQRAIAPIAGSFEERREHLAEAVHAWALGRLGEPAQENDWYAYVEASFPDSVVATVARWTPESSRETFRFDYTISDGRPVLGDPEPVEITAKVESLGRVVQLAPHLAARRRKQLGAGLRLRATGVEIKPPPQQ
jgi:HK97 family phage prohead protease